MLKRHFAVKVPYSTEQQAACGRGRVLTENVNQVTCLTCKTKDAFILAKDEAASKAEAAFQAQTPRQHRHLWDNGVIVCTCGCDLWRERPRSLLSFHLVCEGCGRHIYPPTETGMSM